VVNISSETRIIQWHKITIDGETQDRSRVGQGIIAQDSILALFYKFK
jgi:hypothetical protein